MSSPGRPAAQRPTPWIRFDRHELAGAFGDLGTDLPLIIGMIAAAGLHPASVLITFGLMQGLTALRYGMPMPVQPLKAMAVLVIAGGVPASVLYGGGLAVGVVMLVLVLTGALDALGRIIPRTVVRGLQLGLGLQLGRVALHDYAPADGAPGYVLAALGFVLVLALRGNRRLPAALPVVGLGLLYALAFRLPPQAFADSFGFALPRLHPLTWADIATGFLVLAIPQVPLSLGNALLATRQVAADLFPERKVGLRRLGFTYAIMNLVNPWLGGIPTCHGSGGLAGHHAFGARTGGSVILYGSLYLVLGLFFSGGFAEVVQIFPRPVLAVLLLFEGIALITLTRDAAHRASDFFIVVMVGLLASGLPQGYLLGLVVGTAAHYLLARRNQPPAAD